METRARRAVCERATALPKDVWQLIISFLAPSEAVRAALVCLDFAAIAAPAAQQACRRLWPHHAQRLVHTGVQRFLRLVQAHEDEVSAHPEVAKAKSVQKTVCPEHRQIAVEWLIEVSLLAFILVLRPRIRPPWRDPRLELRSSRSLVLSRNCCPSLASGLRRILCKAYTDTKRFD